MFSDVDAVAIAMVRRLDQSLVLPSRHPLCKLHEELRRFNFQLRAETKLMLTYLHRMAVSIFVPHYNLIMSGKP